MHVFAPEIPQVYLSLFNSQQEAKQKVIIVQRGWIKQQMQWPNNFVLQRD